MLSAISRKIDDTLRLIFESGTRDFARPVVDSNFESNLPGVYVVGDLVGAPVVKLAMEQGYKVACHILELPDARSSRPDAYDVIVVGAGAAGLNAALTLQEGGLRVLVLEKGKIANTIQDFPAGKWVYAEPDSVPPKGKLWLDGATKEDLIARWHQIVQENHLRVHTEEPLVGLKALPDRHYEVQTPRQTYVSRRVILATGQRGNPRHLNVPGEDRENIYHRLYNPGHFQGKKILVVGGGNSAVEAALTLCEKNQVTLSYRRSEFYRLFKDNRQKLSKAVAEGKIQLLLNSEVVRFDENTAVLRVQQNGQQTEKRIPYDYAFVLIGSEIPAAFLKSLGLKLENEWKGNPLASLALVVLVMVNLWIFGGNSGSKFLNDLQLAGGMGAVASLFALVRSGMRGNRYSWLGLSFLIAYTIYGAKQGAGYELWPYTGWGFEALSFFGRPWSFWYTVLYTLVMTVFGLQAMKRWGFQRRDRFQVWRYVSLLSFQWIFFFLIPEFLFQWAIRYAWVGEKLANDPTFADQPWRAYGLVYAWPLFFYTFIGNPHKIWVIWGVLLSFVILPIFAIFHGKRYCSWICGCGGLAETLGDRWRHLAPKGRTSIRLESMNTVVLIAAAAITATILLRDALGLLSGAASSGLHWYHLVADVWLVGIVPVTLYPFLGGKIWCRYWCPLAKLMELYSRFFTKRGVGKFAIYANDKCIACGECSRYCQVGIDVMNFALKQETITNVNSSCIGCGICVTVCPMDVLSFRPPTMQHRVLIQISPPSSDRARKDTAVQAS